MTLRLVGVAAAYVALHRSARSRGYKLSREKADPKSLGWGCVFDQSALLAFPFIVPKGRAQVTVMVNR
jgi:hypothetical protein